MLQYNGGKNLTLRHYGMDKAIADLITACKPQRIFDPTTGGGSVVEYICSLPLPADTRIIASDLHPAGICLLRALASDHAPPAVLAEDEWNTAKARGQVPWRDCQGCKFGERSLPHTCPAGTDPLHGFAGFGVSYGGMYYQGYGGRSRPKWRDPVGGMAKACIKAGKHLKRVSEWHVCNYYEVVGPPGSGALHTAGEGDLIYADIPYKGTLGYKGLPAFDHPRYWAWALACERAGATVATSEFTAPPPFTPWWTCSKAQPGRNGRPGSTSEFVQDHIFMLPYGYEHSDP